MRAQLWVPCTYLRRYQDSTDNIMAPSCPIPMCENSSSITMSNMPSAFAEPMHRRIAIESLLNPTEPHDNTTHHLAHSPGAIAPTLWADLIQSMPSLGTPALRAHVNTWLASIDPGSSINLGSTAFDSPHAAPVSLVSSCDLPSSSIPSTTTATLSIHTPPHQHLTLPSIHVPPYQHTTLPSIHHVVQGLAREHPSFPDPFHALPITQVFLPPLIGAISPYHYGAVGDHPNHNNTAQPLYDSATTHSTTLSMSLDRRQSPSPAWLHGGMDDDNNMEEEEVVEEKEEWLRQQPVEHFWVPGRGWQPGPWRS